MTTLERVSEFFQELTKLGLFDHMAGMSDLTHPDKINSLCDAVDAAIEKEPKPKLYTLQMWGCVEPNLYGPYANEDERVAAAKAMNDSEEDSYCRVDVDSDGVPSVASFVNGEISDDEDDETSEDHEH